MQLTTADFRVILDALECRLAHFREEQAGLDQQDRIAELSNDIYYDEFLRDCVAAEYANHITQIQENYQAVVHDHLIPHAARQVAEHPESYAERP